MNIGFFVLLIWLISIPLGLRLYEYVLSFDSVQLLVGGGSPLGLGLGFLCLGFVAVVISIVLRLLFELYILVHKRFNPK